MNDKQLIWLGIRHFGELAANHGTDALGTCGAIFDKSVKLHRSRSGIGRICRDSHSGEMAGSHPDSRVMPDWMN